MRDTSPLTARSSYLPPTASQPTPADSPLTPPDCQLASSASVVHNAKATEFYSGPVQCELSTQPHLADHNVPMDQSWPKRWYHWPLWLVGRSWDLASLCVLLAVVAAIPIVQLASLGYLLYAAAGLAHGRAWSSALPGMHLAGRLGVFALLAFLLRLPVAFVHDLSYSAQLLLPDSREASLWRAAAFILTLLWVTHVVWAAMRGGKLRHFLWPAPLRFGREFFKRQTWGPASDKLYGVVAQLHFPRLWFLGLRATCGALVWIALPVTFMIIGQRSENFPPAALVGLVGAVGMLVVSLYLPFLQIQLAQQNRLRAVFDLKQVRRHFLCAPWAHAIALWMLVLLCIPLYLLRIEATPAELMWAPSLVFIVFMLPAKLLLGAAVGYAAGRRTRLEHPTRHWSMRWSARFVGLASALVYVGALYLAQLVAGQGALVMYFQHAFLVPTPLISS